MFSGRPSVPLSSVRPSVRDSRGSFMFPRYLQYLLTDFRQTFVTGASRERDDLITFLGQKVKVQGHAIPAEAHRTRRYRRVQLFLVSIYMHIRVHFVTRDIIRSYGKRFLQGVSIALLCNNASPVLAIVGMSLCPSDRLSHAGIE